MVLTRFSWALLSFLILGWTTLQAAELRIPAFTAYTLPDYDTVRISERRGITEWRDPDITVNWYGSFSEPGEVIARVELKLPEGAESRLRLSVGEQSRDVVVSGQESNRLAVADFGTFTVSSTGYHRFSLTSLNQRGTPAGELESLVLDGPAAAAAKFNLKERRNAASVHLAYVYPVDVPVAAFYCEVTALEDPVATFYMACGWHRGYFGMQVNSRSERRIIFSVWDSGNESVDRKKVAADDRVVLLEKGPSVFAGDFGNEGTGGHSHLKYLWKTGEPQRFIVTAVPADKTHTVYTGYWFHPENGTWSLISSWKAPRDGERLKGLHSFSENFGGSTGHLLRKARYGNQWLLTDRGEWKEITSARFSHDPTGRSDRLDRFMGIEAGQFFLSHGGFVPGSTMFGVPFDRPATGRPPEGLEPLVTRP